MGSAKSGLGTQNTLSSALGSLFMSWEQVEADYLSGLFSGNATNSSVSDLYSLIQGGLMNFVSNSTDLTSMTAQAQKILYAQMIPTAWSLAPGPLHPYIL
jgi:hypothetical protein